jgi:predicted dehydrogenase
VRNGRIGKVTHAVVPVGPAPRPDFPDSSARAKPPDREVFDWDLWLGPAPWRPYPGSHGVHDWQGREDFGLGSIGNWGSHVLDMAQWALGKDAEGPVEILPPTKDAPHVTIRYADGVAIRCPRTPDDAADVSVFGTEGVKKIFGSATVAEKYDPAPLGPGDTLLYRPEGDDHYRNWLECIRTRNKPVANEVEGHYSSAACYMALEAYRTRAAVTWNPQWTVPA